MAAPVEIAYRDLSPAEHIEKAVRERAEKLHRLYDRIELCRVVIEAPHRQHRKGNHFLVRIRVGVPGEDLHVNREPRDDHAHEDLHVALRDSFDAAERQLKDFLARRRERTRP